MAPHPVPQGPGYGVEFRAANASGWQGASEYNDVLAGVKVRLLLALFFKGGRGPHSVSLGRFRSLATVARCVAAGRARLPRSDRQGLNYPALTLGVCPPCLLQFLAAQPEVDAKRIGIHGLSYGGLNAMQALTRNSDLFAAGVVCDRLA